MRMLLLAAFVFASLSAFEARAISPAPSDGTTSRITYVENGWFGEGLAVHLSAPLTYATQCAAAANDFAVAASHPMFKEISAMIMLAYASGAPVQLMVDPASCIFGNRTSIVAV